MQTSCLGGLRPVLGNVETNAQMCVSVTQGALFRETSEPAKPHPILAKAPARLSGVLAFLVLFSNLRGLNGTRQSRFPELKLAQRLQI
jgi:hypothetical protein